MEHILFCTAQSRKYAELSAKQNLQHISFRDTGCTIRIK